MKTEDVVLGILNEKSQTGYDIVEKIKTIFSHFFDGSYGSIYPVLHKLENKGKVTKKIIVQEGKPNKNLYSITESGREEFNKYLRSPVQTEVMKSDFLMRLYHGEYLPEEQIKQIIIEEINRKEQLVEELESQFEVWKEDMSSYQKLCCQIGIESYRSEIEILKKFQGH
ncbi:PadR family transcriptional regulator [Sporolactobacillus shoreicorticis]|uniref:PadR family transcriptional regulator n=1 Tax=Sporolactobacillus shoreicorticis TaxID=1923877 RepID=A0ABW5S3D9_9BACL|nr:PadR family transcriptional regulator [Sporolactobacillus shoreicorticis]MCO7126496.1 PadR family transcriptional regulator [Sporolactobacillus shoreicorticis]